MGSKLVLIFLTSFVGFGAYAGDDREFIDECYRSSKEDLASPNDSVDNQKIVPMIDEIARRSKTNVERLSRTIPARSAEVLQKYFAKQINQNSPLLQVDQRGLADELRRTLIGRGHEDSDWRLASESKIDIDGHDRFYSAVGALEHREKGVYQVACINIGQVRMQNFLAELRCQELTSRFSEKVYLKRHFNFQEEILREEKMYKMLKNPLREMYACFLSQSQS